MSDPELVCCDCGMPAGEFEDEPKPNCPGGLYRCPVCTIDHDEEVSRDDARQYALENCRITSKLPEYDSEVHYAVTPEEFEEGDKESHTPNALLAYARHNCSNYDELIKGLAKMDGADRTYYSAIRKRIDKMICEAEPSIGAEFNDDSEPA